ncbi:MAG TPA: hypothetical protein VMK65_01100, partial [Longimicrobiales bacterium]|nr:hypothetical protein [Longimicrobiales bacterium]
DSLGSLRAAAEVEVLRTEDGWARVRLEGWVPLAELEEVPGGAVLRGLTRAELAADPDRYRGRLVEWQLRFISLERAEAGRSEFGAGERYLLMRGPGAAPGFVYVAVADDALPRVRALVPLQAVRVLARVRMARSPLTGVPVLELLELEPIPGN